jgi:hypothetical protein
MLLAYRGVSRRLWSAAAACSVAPSQPDPKSLTSPATEPASRHLQPFQGGLHGTVQPTVNQTVLCGFDSRPGRRPVGGAGRGCRVGHGRSPVRAGASSNGAVLGLWRRRCATRHRAHPPPGSGLTSPARPGLHTSGLAANEPTFCHLVVRRGRVACQGETRRMTDSHPGCDQLCADRYPL